MIALGEPTLGGVAREELEQADDDKGIFIDSTCDAIEMERKKVDNTGASSRGRRPSTCRNDTTFAHCS